MARTARRSGPSKSSRISPEATAHRSGSRQSHPQLAPKAKTAQDPSRQPDLSTEVDTQCALHGQQASRGPCVARQSGGQTAEHLPHPDLIARPSWASFATARDAIRRRPSRTQEHFRNHGGLCGDRRAGCTRIGKSPELSAPLACEERANRAGAAAVTGVGDGSGWCRLPHAMLCPARDTLPAVPELAGLRRALAVDTRRQIDSGAFVPSSALPNTEASPMTTCRPARPVVQLLYIRYPANRPVDEIQCVAQTRRRHRCANPLLTPECQVGVWTLVPLTARHGQLPLPGAAMTLYALTGLPYAEQLRRRAQRCPEHVAIPTAADVAVAEWEPFDPPHPPRAHSHPDPDTHPTPRACRPGQEGDAAVSTRHAIEITLTRPGTDCELRRARRIAAPASNNDRTRLLTLQHAKTHGRALRALRRRLDAVLPIDVLTTHYPDRQGRVLLKRALSRTARTPSARLRQSAVNGPGTS
ncbi:DUF6083 domain-containing protein [Streptomyces mirabilis]|uniref:DUF6083 domain-containing protein n=1 Tax=Streptomyces mirabilis TaxID=68239 RepID=UPI0032E35D2D